MATTPSARPFAPAFWASLLPIAQPLVQMISDRLDAINLKPHRESQFWDDAWDAMAAHDLEAWLIKQNVEARAEHTRTFSVAQWNAVMAWKGECAWDTLVLALLWRAVSDRRIPDPILNLG